MVYKYFEINLELGMRMHVGSKDGIAMFEDYDH
jgi:hypothetical protein